MIAASRMGLLLAVVDELIKALSVLQGRDEGDSP